MSYVNNNWSTCEVNDGATALSSRDIIKVVTRRHGMAVESILVSYSATTITNICRKKLSTFSLKKPIYVVLTTSRLEAIPASWFERIDLAISSLRDQCQPEFFISSSRLQTIIDSIAVDS